MSTGPGDKKRETPAEMTPVALAPGQGKCWEKKKDSDPYIV